MSMSNAHEYCWRARLKVILVRSRFLSKSICAHVCNLEKVHTCSSCIKTAVVFCLSDVWEQREYKNIRSFAVRIFDRIFVRKNQVSFHRWLISICPVEIGIPHHVIHPQAIIMATCIEMRHSLVSLLALKIYGWQNVHYTTNVTALL